MEQTSAPGTLFVLPCTKTKIWSNHPELLSVSACLAYQGQLFLKAKAFVDELFGEYVILSAKYGWLFPSDPIMDYEVTFKTVKPNIRLLTQQASIVSLPLYSKFVVLGGRVYAGVVQQVFPTKDIFVPLRGLPIGKMLSALTPPNTEDLERRVLEFIEKR